MTFRYSLAALLLAGCSTLPNSNAWYPTTMEPMEKYVWIQKKPQEIESYCGPTRQGIGSFIQACAVRVWSTRTCHIFSIVPESLARGIPDASGRFSSLAEHEAAHCGLAESAKGVIWEHP